MRKELTKHLAKSVEAADTTGKTPEQIADEIADQQVTQFLKKWELERVRRGEEERVKVKDILSFVRLFFRDPS